MTNSDTDSNFLEHLERIANALEKRSPTDPTPEDLEPASTLKGCAGPGHFKRREGSKIPSVLELAGLSSRPAPGR